MYTSILLIALSGIAPAAEATESPSWRKDYAAAREEGAREGKPLAVFVGSGTTGWKELARGGELGEEARRILADGYISVYLDQETEEGKRLAEGLEIPDGQAGIVLSDASGEYQAFRHVGDMAIQDLERNLERYADPNRVARSTESNPGSTSYYEGRGYYAGSNGYSSNNGNCRH